ncbi:MAG: leucyl/phenylalanyl-tRNA--protein transferase [Proteobacteria bacterium]|nr:leucyl/phenylalanyl-tRNA--protein transferase [Pseudomonadota bacterium]
MDAQQLTARVLLASYTNGCFPMPNARNPNVIDFYRPDPRALIPLNEFHVSRSMRRELRRTDLHTQFNTCFETVMRECADRPDTWITEDFVRAYGELHALGFAHSVEIFHGEKLAGGVYGVAVGAAFFAESMFHKEKNMSKLALYRLVEQLLRKDFELLECQFLTPHLMSLGATTVPDEQYMDMLSAALERDATFV